MRYMIAILALLSGCGTLSEETKRREITYQLVNAADAITTISLPSPQYREVGAWRVIGGDYPSSEQSLMAAAAGGALHFAITQILDHYDAPKWMQTGWQYITIGASSFSVGNNLTLISQRDR